MLIGSEQVLVQKNWAIDPCYKLLSYDSDNMMEDWMLEVILAINLNAKIYNVFCDQIAWNRFSLRYIS